MPSHPSRRLAVLAASVIGFVVATPAFAQTAPCVFEYRRADNMWANWGRPDGLIGTETITLQPGQKKVFVTDWSYEKQKNDGTNFYGSHLRRAVNRGAGPLQIKVRGPGSMFSFAKVAAALVSTTLQPTVLGGTAGAFVKLVLGSSPTFQPGDSALFRHDLAEVSCPGAATVVASVAPPPAPPVVLSLTGARSLTGSKVTVTANDAASGAALTGKVTINGASGELGKEIPFTSCSETLDIEDARGVTRTRTLRAPCEGVVQIGGYPDTYFNF
ncbi:MAG TPA: hypothetical protein VJT85_09930 [Gemmatimonadaceae bacterium]|nr:hypothetical protein [Gemmatimonadaceae bacterium]